MAAAVGLMCGFFSRQARTKSFHSGECRVGKYILLLYMISVAVWTCTLIEAALLPACRNISLLMTRMHSKMKALRLHSTGVVRSLQLCCTD